MWWCVDRKTVKTLDNGRVNEQQQQLRILAVVGSSGSSSSVIRYPKPANQRNGKRADNNRSNKLTKKLKRSEANCCFFSPVFHSTFLHPKRPHVFTCGLRPYHATITVSVNGDDIRLNDVRRVTNNNDGGESGGLFFFFISEQKWNWWILMNVEFSF